MPITDRGMRAFRTAATLADVIPDARVQVHDGERLLLTVTRSHPAPDAGGVVLPPCAFRAAVARAHRRHREGARFQFLDLPADRRPSIHIGLPAGDAVLPGQIYRIRASDGRLLLLFVTDLSPTDCERAFAEAIDDDGADDQAGEPTGPGQEIGFHPDPTTQLTVVHTFATPERGDLVAKLMCRLLEVCVATEAIADLGRHAHHHRMP